MTTELADVLAAAAERGDKSPALYLDANVLLDIVRPQRRSEPKHLLEEWRARSWTCVSSYFGLMEALDVEQESMWARSQIRRGQSVEWLIRNRRERELSPHARGRVASSFFKEFVTEVQDYIDWGSLDDEGWEEAIRLAMQTDCSAPDSIHVATALLYGCDVLVTWDEGLRRTAAREIPIATPGQVLSSIQSREL